MSPYTIILQALRSAPLSLADLQQTTQVSLPTLRKVVQELVDTRWIRIVGQAEANGGRPPKMYGLDTSYHVVIGVHLQLPNIHLVTTNLHGQVLEEQHLIREDVPHPDQALAAIADYVQRSSNSMTERKILGIGIAAPGFLEPESGDILSIGRVSGWNNFPICRRLTALLRTPTQIANDIDCMAFAEFRSHGPSLDHNLVYVGFDEAVRASLFLNGELYRGALGNPGLIVGDLLHVEGVEDPEVKQMVLTIRGLNALIEQRLKALPAETRAAYQSILTVDEPRQRLESLLQGPPGRYPECSAVVDLMLKTLAAAVANLIIIIQPDYLVLGGILSSMNAGLFSEFEAQVRHLLPRLISHKATLQVGKVTSPNSAAIGAVHHLLDQQLIEQPATLF